jgi:hypothetical protein
MWGTKKPTKLRPPIPTHVTVARVIDTGNCLIEWRAGSDHGEVLFAWAFDPFDPVWQFLCSQVDKVRRQNLDVGIAEHIE